jgi:hypothetical protein
MNFTLLNFIFLMSVPRQRKRDDTLYVLVQSMTQQERRYYVRFARQFAHGEDSPYLQVFQLLANMEAYNEKALLEQLPDTHRQHFSATKYQLHAHILRGLRQYHQDRDADTVLLNARQELSILAEKGLWKAFEKVLHRAERLADHHERWSHLLALLDLKRNALLHQPTWKEGLQASTWKEDLQELRTREVEYTRQLDQENALKSLHTRIRLLAKLRGKPAPTPDADHLEAILEDLAAATPSIPSGKGVPAEANTPDVPAGKVAAACYYNILGIAALLRGQYAEAFNHLNAVRLHWFAHHAFIGLHQDLFRTSLTNFFNVCLFTGDMVAYTEAEQSLIHLTDISTNNRLQIDDLRYYNRLRYALNRGLFEEGKTLTTEIDTWLQAQERHLDPARVMHFLHNIQLFHFFDANFKTALKYTRRIQSQENADLRKDIQAFSHLMELILRYELDDHNLLEYQLRAYQRRFKTTKPAKPQDLAKTVTTLMTSLLANPTTDTKPHFTEAATLLQTWEPNPETQPPFGYWEIRLWAESRACGVGVRDHFLDKLG